MSVYADASDEDCNRSSLSRFDLSESNCGLQGISEDMDVGSIGRQPWRVSQITPGYPWPEYLQNLVNRPTDGVLKDREVLVAEVLSLLCHAALVEVGFVPYKPEVTAKEVCAMPNINRIQRFGRQVDRDGYNSDAAMFAWRYCVINSIRAVTAMPDRTESPCDSTGTSRGESKIESDDSETAASLKDMFEYSFSSPCSVIIIPSGSQLQVFCNFSGSDGKPFQHKILIDLRTFVETSIGDLSTKKQSPEKWMKALRFNGTKFYSFFKVSFGGLCLDAMNGIMFDQRGLVCLPPEVLVRIFAYSDIHSIRNARLACKYLNDVANIPSLWRTLIRRDFGVAPTVPAPSARFARVTNRVPYNLSANISGAQQDYKSIYEAQMRLNLRSRMDASAGLGFGNRLGGRPLWLPYVAPPRPYILRLNDDQNPFSSA